MFTKPQSRSFIVIGISHAPALSNNSSSTLFTCFINALLVQIVIDIPSSNAATEYPTKTTFPVMLHEEAMSTLTIDRDRMKGCDKLFTCDGSKKITHHVIKIVSWWHVDRIMNF